MTNKTAGLLQWCQLQTAGYEGVNVTNFTTSWKDGKAFCALVHRFRPDLIDFEKCTDKQEDNLEMAFAAAEKAGITRMMDVEDFDCEVPDRLSVMTCIGVIQQGFEGTVATPQPTTETSKKQYTQYETYSSRSPPPRPRSKDLDEKTSNSNITEEKRKRAATTTSTTTRQLEVCLSCQKPIYGGALLEIRGKKYHRFCFNCKKCGNKLEETSFVNIDDGNYCLACGKAVFSQKKQEKEAAKAAESTKIEQTNNNEDDVELQKLEEEQRLLEKELEEEDKQFAEEERKLAEEEKKITEEKKNINEPKKAPTRISSDWRERKIQQEKLRKEKEEAERRQKEEKIQRLKQMRQTSPQPATTEPTCASIEFTKPRSKSPIAINKTVIFDSKTSETQPITRKSHEIRTNETPSPSSSPTFIDQNTDDWVSGGTIKKRTTAKRPIITPIAAEKSVSIKISVPKPILLMWQFYVFVLVLILIIIGVIYYLIH
ncbi:Alpha-actinin [Entamoeba marina]